MTKLISDIESSNKNHEDERSMNVPSIRLGPFQLQLNNMNMAVEPLVLEGDAEQNYVRTIKCNDRSSTYIAKLSQEKEEAQRT